jgi:FkbM family methyltransferase
MGKLKKTLEYATKVLQFAIRVGGGRYATDISIYLSERLVPVIPVETIFGVIKFYCQGTLPAYRAITLLTKEPETIEWINDFDRSDILWDIGANVGVYSLYAALKGINVNAFEPAPGNYYLLSRNIEINGFDERISSFCIAFNDQTCLDYFLMSNTKLGSSMNTFGQAIDWKGSAYEVQFKQSMVGFTVDDFIHQFSPAFPNHIKIDVDGIENKILHGASETLGDRRVKSLLVELNTDLNEQCSNVIRMLESKGLHLYKKESTLSNDEFSMVCNHIFKREV